ncbi:MAG: C39 family peptidase [Bacteroides sp.]|nr:C39 family peptidase [Bacteroides sp.]MCM1549657.1 C39 family peptidase [Clostridium sp.]
MKHIWIGVGIFGFLLLAIAYFLMTPLSRLVADGGSKEGWTQAVTDFKGRYEAVSRQYGYYDWEEMEVLPGEIPVVYFNQADPAWGSSYYDTRRVKKQTIRSGGCGPTSLAIVYSSLTQEVMTPADMADFAMEHGYCAAPQGSYRSLFTSGAEQLGLTCYYSGEDLETALSYLSEDCLVVSLMGPGIFCDGGHFLVIRGVTEDGMVLLADCWNAANNEKEWGINTIAQNLKTDGGGCLWVLGLEEGGSE